MNKWILLLLFPITALAAPLPDAVDNLNSTVTNLESTTGDLSGDVTGLLDKYLMTNGGKCPLLVVGVGSGSSLPISFIPGPHPIAGLQADVITSSLITVTAMTAGQAAADAGKSLQMVSVAGGARFLIVGFNQTPIAAGTVATVNLDMTQATIGPHTLALVNFTASDPNGNTVPVCTTTGVITK